MSRDAPGAAPTRVTFLTREPRAGSQIPLSSLVFVNYTKTENLSSTVSVVHYEVGEDAILESNLRQAVPPCWFFFFLVIVGGQPNDFTEFRA